MIIGGTSIKEWKLKSNKKRIPEYLIKDSKFINALINEVGNYVEGDPVSCLSKLKEKVWELVFSVERQKERSSPFQRTMETLDNHQTPCKDQNFKENFSHTLFLFVGT